MVIFVTLRVGLFLGTIVKQQQKNKITIMVIGLLLILLIKLNQIF